MTASDSKATKSLLISYSLLEVSLDTTREEELRLQLSLEGLPTVGDLAHHAVTNPLRRLGLHLSELRIVHPSTKEWLTLSSPTPLSFTKYLEQLSNEKYVNENTINNYPLHNNDNTSLKSSQNETPVVKDVSNSIKVISLADFLNKT